MNTILSLFLLFVYITLNANELEDRKELKDKVANLYKTGQFAEMEQLSGEFLKKEERTSSGLWKLAFFYDGASSVANLNTTNESYWTQLENKALNLVDSYPNSAFSHLIYVDTLIRHAWMYHKRKCCSKVQSQYREVFDVLIAKARSELNVKKTITSKDPRWYELMLIVAREQGWDKEEFFILVEEATTKFPYYHEIYFASVDYLLPKWYGSDDEIEIFAQKAVEITNGKINNAMYARIYWYVIAKNSGHKPLYKKSSVDWHQMKTAIKNIIEQYPVQWNINNFAHIACLAGDPILTHKLMKKIKLAPMIYGCWDNFSFYQQCKQWSETVTKKNILYNTKSNLL